MFLDQQEIGLISMIRGILGCFHTVKAKRPSQEPRDNRRCCLFLPNRKIEQSTKGTATKDSEPPRVVILVSPAGQEPQPSGVLMNSKVKGDGWKKEEDININYAPMTSHRDDGSVK